MKTSATKMPRRKLEQCSNCGEECHLLAAMIGENGEIIQLCEQCLRDSE